MSDDEREAMRQWVERWKVVGPILEELRRKELPFVSTPDAIEALDSCFQAALKLPPRTTSGLVIQQALFAKLRQ